MTKQGMHQLLNRTLKQMEESMYIKGILEQIRKDHPTMSCRAMYYKIRPRTLGRDRFERLCKELGFTVERKPKHPRTTDSCGVIRFDNLLKELKVTALNQAWSSDITYYEVGETFYYLTFIIDVYSRTILGHSVSSRLTTEQTTIAALHKALKKRGKHLRDTQLVFHSDGGGQYYDKNFLKLTRHHNFKNSMCEYAYENGKAERVNGVIKNNYLQHRNIQTPDELRREVDRCVNLYNTEKPHKSLGYKTPLQFEKEILSLNGQNPSGNRQADVQKIEMNLVNS